MKATSLRALELRLVDYGVGITKVKGPQGKYLYTLYCWDTATLQALTDSPLKTWLRATDMDRATTLRRGNTLLFLIPARKRLLQMAKAQKA